MNSFRTAVVVALLALLGQPVAALQSVSGPLSVHKVATGLDDAWSIGFLPDGSFLVTERAGRLLHVNGSQAQAVKGVPKTTDKGQGGLLDVLVPRDFPQTREIFLTYAKPQQGASGTALAKARLSKDARRLENVTTIFEMSEGSSGGRHFGSRLVEAPDGSIFMTIGERGDRPAAQDLSRHNGSVVRVTRDGGVPPDNPFSAVSGARPEIWSYGHRNPQGAALDASGQLWIHEHGAKGGDELNRIKPGANFGWPNIAYGRHYSGAKIGQGTSAPGMEQPVHYWDPSIAPSGLAIYSGKLWPEWRGDFLIGSLKFDMISRVDGQTFREVERIEGPETGRVRDVREAPDGSIWFISETDGAIYRMTPGS